MKTVYVRKSDSAIFHNLDILKGKSEEELKAEGVFCELPEPVEIDNKIAVLKFDGINLYYDYEDITPSIDEEVAQLKEEKKMLNLKVDALSNQNEMLESVVQELIVMVIP